MAVALVAFLVAPAVARAAGTPDIRMGGVSVVGQQANATATTPTTFRYTATFANTSVVDGMTNPYAYFVTEGDVDAPSPLPPNCSNLLNVAVACALEPLAAGASVEATFDFALANPSPFGALEIYFYDRTGNDIWPWGYTPVSHRYNFPPIDDLKATFVSQTPIATEQAGSNPPPPGDGPLLSDDVDFAYDVSNTRASSAVEPTVSIMFNTGTIDVDLESIMVGGTQVGTCTQRFDSGTIITCPVTQEVTAGFASSLTFTLRAGAGMQAGAYRAGFLGVIFDDAVDNRPVNSSGSDATRVPRFFKAATPLISTDGTTAATSGAPTYTTGSSFDASYQFGNSGDFTLGQSTVTYAYEAGLAPGALPGPCSDNVVVRIVTCDVGPIGSEVYDEMPKDVGLVVPFTHSGAIASQLVISFGNVADGFATVTITATPPTTAIEDQADAPVPALVERTLSNRDAFEVTHVFRARGDRALVDPVATWTYVPTELTLSGALPAGCVDQPTGTITCDLSGLGIDDRATRTIAFTSGSGVSASEVAISFAADNAATTTVVQDLTFVTTRSRTLLRARYGDQADTGSTIEEDDRVGYRLSIDNSNAATAGGDPVTGVAHDVVLRITPDPRLDWSGVAGDCDADGSDFLCPVGDIASGASRNVTFSPRLPAGTYPSGTVLTNTFTITSGDGVNDVSTSEQRRFVETTPVADTSPTCTAATVSAPLLTRAAARAGASSTLAAPTCTSYWDGDAVDLVVRTPDSLTHAGTLAITNGGAYVWTPDAAALAADVPVSDRFLVDVYPWEYDADYSGPNPATVELRFGIAPTQADVSVTLESPSTLTVAPAGTSGEVTATVANAGPELAPGVELVWTVAGSVRVDAATLAGAACTTAPDGASQRVVCAPRTVASGSSMSSSLTLHWAPGARGLVLPGTASISVGVAASEQYVDIATANNQASADVRLTAAAVTPTPDPTPDPDPDPTSNVPTPRADLLTGTHRRDRIDGGRGNDTVFGRGGNDLLFGGLGDDRLFGGLGSDMLDGGVGKDRLRGGPGNDTLHGRAGDDDLDGGAGDDRVLGYAGNDRLAGGPGNDTVACGIGADIAKGGTGADRLDCADGTRGDTLDGEAGQDTCVGDVGDRFVNCERIVRR